MTQIMILLNETMLYYRMLTSDESNSRTQRLGKKKLDRNVFHSPIIALQHMVQGQWDSFLVNVWLPYLDSSSSTF